MKSFTLTKLGRVMLIAVMVTVGLAGCGGDDGGANPGGGNSTGGGGSIVGDWLQMTSTSGGTTTIIEDGSVGRSVVSFKSSGEYSYSFFFNNGSVWSESNMVADFGQRHTWRTVGSTLNTTIFYGGQEQRTTYTYLVSNDNLTITITSVTVDGIEIPAYVGVSGTYKKIDLASYRRSLGL
jgi:hypothetical protein